MNLSELLNSPVMDDVIKSVTSKLDVDEKQATQTIQTAVPVMLGKMITNAQSADGAKSLNKALDNKHDGSILDNISNVDLSSFQEDGKGILNHVFGDKKENLQKNVAKKSGLSVDKIEPILAMVAPVVMGYLGKEKRKTGADSNDIVGMLSSIVGEGAIGGLTSGKGDGIMDMVTGFLDKDNDGSVIDDVLGIFK